jgi:hypothetical protein
VAIRSAKDVPILEGHIEDSSPPPASSDGEARAAGDGAVARASLSLAPIGDHPLYGSAAFFDAAAEQLAVSTEHGLELAGAVYARRAGDRTLLLGVKRCSSGQPGRVAVDPSWGSILWHTHPGLKGSLAAFSNEDLEAARVAGKPLLVIGFGGLSPDVITTLTLPMGWKALLLSGSVKGLLSLEKHGKLKRRLLRLGVAARVCYPSGRIQPVMRRRAAPWQHAFDDVSFLVDRSIGAVERTGQAALGKVLRAVAERIAR